MELSRASEEKLRNIAETLKAIAHPIRLKTLCLLSKGGKCVSELESDLGKEQAIVSQQLKILRLNGLVEVKRQNGFAMYSIAEDKKPHLQALLGGLCQMM